MTRWRLIWPVLGLLSSAGPASAVPALTADAVEHAAFAPLPPQADRQVLPNVVKAEVWLARAGFSPGEIDGVAGDNFRKALQAYQSQNGLPANGTFDQATWDKMATDTAPTVQRYEITAAEAKGPFTSRIPTQFVAQSRLKRLGYRNIREELAERFRMSVPLLLSLNRGTPLAGGKAIDVLAAAPSSPPAKAARVVVDKAGHDVEAFGADGKLLAFYPASIGSEEKPAPSGQFVIRRVVHHPDYTYDPKYHFKGVNSKEPFTIAPGPNNPVGSVWLDLSDEGYGIHGTPEPGFIGKTQSHGCIRLTNWDIENLAGLVGKDTPVSLEEGPVPALAPPPVATTPAPSVTPAPAPSASPNPAPGGAAKT